MVDEVVEYYVPSSVPQGEPTLPTPAPEAVNAPYENLLPSETSDGAPVPLPVAPPMDGQGIEHLPVHPGIELPPTDPTANPGSGANDWQPAIQDYHQASYSTRFPAQSAQPAQYAEQVEESPEEQTSAALRRYMSDDADGVPSQ